MTGLDRIIEKINADCKSECAAVVESAEKKAKEIVDEAAAQSAELSQEILDRARTLADETVKRGEAAAQQLERQTLLRYRTQAVNAVLAHALEELKGMDAAEYFIALETLAVKSAQPGTGIMYMNSRDLAAMPGSFPAKLAAALPQGCKIVISNEARPLESGFVLVYGDIDINCTFDALADARSDELKEKICSIIF